MAVPADDPDVIALQVQGESMYPTLFDGDHVLMSPNATWYEGDVVVAEVADGPEEFVIKRLGRMDDDDDGVMLVSDNFLRYPPRLYGKREVAIRGRVLRVIRTPSRREARFLGNVEFAEGASLRVHPAGDDVSAQAQRTRAAGRSRNISRCWRKKIDSVTGRIYRVFFLDEIADGQQVSLATARSGRSATQRLRLVLSFSLFLASLGKYSYGTPVRRRQRHTDDVPAPGLAARRGRPQWSHRPHRDASQREVGLRFQSRA